MLVMLQWFQNISKKKKRKQSKCLFKFEFQIMKLVQFELFNLMPNSSEIQPNSKQHKYLKFSKTKVGALGHFEC